MLLTAFAVRSMSQQWSPLPYNIDGLSELKVTQDILSSNHLDFQPTSSVSQGYISDMPILGLFVAFSSSAFGVDPLVSTQLLASIMGAIAVLIIFLIFRQHWPSSNLGALASALSLALLGTFVFSAGCTWKETMGFVLLGLVLYSFPLRRSASYRLLMTSSLLLFVLTHHLITVVGYVIVTFAVALELASKSWEDVKIVSSNDALDAVTVIGMWILATFYYSRIHLPYLDYLSPSTDLYLYIAVALLVLIIAVRISVSEKPITKIPIGLSVPIIGAIIMVYNFYHPLFPGLPGPASLVAVPFLAYLILVVPAWGGAGLILRTRSPSKNLLLAMILGPLSLILFAFLRSNDATSQLTIYRTFDFLMPAFAILVGLGFALLVRNTKKLGIAAGISLVIVCASTLPVAYNSQQMFGVENQTYWFEYDAVRWLSEHNVTSYASDQRLGETGWRLFDLEYGRGVPYALQEGLKLNESSFFVLERSWAKEGAQEFPFGVVKLDPSKLDAVLAETSVLYVGGPSGTGLICFRTGPW